MGKKRKTYRIPGINEPLVKTGRSMTVDELEELIRQGKMEKIGDGLYKRIAEKENGEK